MRLVTSGDTYLPSHQAMIATLANCFKDTPFTVHNQDNIFLGIDTYTDSSEAQHLFQFSTDLQGMQYLSISIPGSNGMQMTIFDNTGGLTEAGSKLFKIIGTEQDGGTTKYKLGTYVCGYGTGVISIHARGNSGMFLMMLPGSQKTVGSFYGYGTGTSGVQNYFLNAARDVTDFYGEKRYNTGSNLYFSPIMLPSTSVVSAVDTNGYCIMPLVLSYGSDKLNNAYIAYGNPAGPTSSGYVTMDGHGFSVHVSPWGEAYNMIFIGDPDRA